MGAQIELDRLKRELFEHGQDNKCEIIVIIEKFREAYKENAWSKHIDPGDFTTPIDWSGSPLAHREEADKMFLDIYTQFGKPPPNNFPKRARELEAKSCRERKAMKKRMAEREKMNDPYRQDSSDENVEFKQNDLMKNMENIVEKISCGNVCNVIDSSNWRKCAAFEPKAVCQKQMNDKYGLTPNEQEFLMEYARKQDTLTNAEKKWRDAEKAKVPGTKLTYMVPWKKAQNDLSDFQQKNVKIIKEIKQKLRKHGEILHERSIYDQQERDKQAKQREEIAKNYVPKGEAAKHWYNVHLPEIEQRLKEQEMERKERQTLKEEAEKEKKWNERMKNVQIKTVDEVFGNDVERRQKFDKEMNQINEYDVSSNANKQKDKTKAVNVESARKKKSNANLGQWKNDNKKSRSQIKKIGKKMLKAMHVLPKNQMNTKKEIKIHDGVLNDYEQGVDVELKPKDNKSSKQKKKSKAKISNKIDPKKHIKISDVQNEHEQGFDISLARAEHYDLELNNMNMLDFNHNAFVDDTNGMNIDLVMLYIGSTLIIFLIFCICMVIGALFGYFIKNNEKTNEQEHDP